MSSESNFGRFHQKRGANIQFLKDGRVAHRKNSYKGGVVFTEQPISIGNMFQVKILDKAGGWAGALRIGFTTHNPNNGALPVGALECYSSPNYWLLSAANVHHGGNERKMKFSIEDLKAGDSIACRVSKNGSLEYYVNGAPKGIGWENLPTEVPLWGFADIYGITSKVKSEFLFEPWPVTVTCPYEKKVEDDLAMKPGDVITVDDWGISEDWARGKLNGKTGVFYKAFVKPSSEVPSPDDFKLKEVRGKPKGYDATYRGREYVLKEKLDEVECIVCHSLTDNVHQTSCCGNTVCLGCASMWKQKNNSCPQCRKAPLEIVVDPKTQRRITGATVYCPNRQFGCDWVDSFGRVTQHLETYCEFEEKKCPNSQCDEVVPKKFLEAHRSKLCLWREEACPCCGMGHRSVEVRPSVTVAPLVLTYYDIITDHRHKCPSWPTRCPNSCAPYLTRTRSTVDSHVKKECPEALTDCKFAEVGCKKKVKRKDMPQHMQEAMSDHMTAMFEDHLKLKCENAQMKKELDQLKSQKK